jgi:hypothetical protein
MYFGIEVVEHDFSDLPVGVSVGDNHNFEFPYEGRGNLYSEDGGQTWGTLSEFEIQGVISIRANLLRFPESTPKERLIGYKVFRENENLMGQDWDGNDNITTLNNYTDLYPLENPEACYQVIAYYDVQQESEKVEFCLGDEIIYTWFITATAGTNGDISPKGIIEVPHGSDQKFDFIPDEGYEIDKVLVDDIEVPSAVQDGFYTFTNITENHSIEVLFKFITGVVENDVSTIRVFSHQNRITIMNEALVPVKTIGVFDMFGRIVWQGQTTAYKTEISLNVSGGIYGVSITTEANKNSFTKVLIVK